MAGANGPDDLRRGLLRARRRPLRLSWRDEVLDVVRRTAEEVFIPFTIGGGIRTVDDIRRMLQHGADKVSFNSAAVANPQVIRAASDKYGAQCIVVAIDAKRVSKAGEKDHWEIFTHGGRNPTGLDAVEYAKEVVALGAGEILLTSMDRDGTQVGYDNLLNRTVAGRVSIPVIASGGCGTLEHVADAFLEGKASAALAASIFHYGRHTIVETKRFLQARGIPVRI